MEAEKIQVRIAGEDEDLDKFRSWLPQAFLSLPRPEFFMGEAQKDGQVIGMGSLRILGEKENKVGRFQLYVLPEHRRKGTGRSLMRAMIDHSRNEGAVSMLAGVPVPDKSANKLFFEALEGFKIQRTLYHFAMNIDVAWNYLDPLVKRLTKKGGLPEGYEIVPLEKADRQRVCRFVLKHLGGIPDALVERLRGKKGGYLPKLSLVVRTVEGPAAVLLVRKSERGLVVDSRVVAPKYRGSWVNVALMYSFVSAVRPMGVKEVYFEGDDQLHEDTMKLARRGACETIETNRLYGCELKPGEAVDE